MSIRHIDYHRPSQVVRKSLPKVLGTISLYSVGYGDVGSSIYYALGVTAFYALGATPLVLAIAGIFFVCTALTYAEGSTMIPEAGGSSSFAKRGFNEMVSFISGWGLMLDYVVTMSISSISAAYYLSIFWPTIKTVPYLPPLIAIVVILLLATINVIGVRETSGVNIFFALLDLSTQAILVILGIVFLLRIPTLLAYLPAFGGVIGKTWPSPQSFIYAVSIAMVAYIGLESVSQMAEESKEPGRMIPKSYSFAVITVLLMYTGISTVALSGMPLSELLTTWHEDPIAGIAHYLPTLHFGTLHLSLSAILGPWVAILAFTILVIACNAGMMGSSRLAFHMGVHKQLPPQLGKIHRTFRTPFMSILFFATMAIGLLLVSSLSHGILLKLADIYSFGAMLAFSIAHASLIMLRIREPETYRPFKMRPSLPITFQGKRILLPLPAILGFAGTFAVWIIVCVTHPWGRTMGFLWMALGAILYTTFRVKAKLPLTGTAIKEKVIAEHLLPSEIRFQRILVPIWGSHSSEEMVKAACKLAKLDGSKVYLLFVIEVPQSLPLDVHIPEEVEKAELALDRAELIANDYDVKMESKLVQSRFAGRTVVEESEANQVDLILFGSTERSTIGEALHGKTMNYVLSHAPCRVWSSLSAGASKKETIQ